MSQNRSEYPRVQRLGEHNRASTDISPPPETIPSPPPSFGPMAFDLVGGLSWDDGEPEHAEPESAVRS